MHFDISRHHGPFASSLLVLAVSTFAVLGIAMPAYAEDTNPLGSMLGFFAGHTDLDQSSIDYRPRAPLVVPPNRDLPEPKEAVRDPAWPKDSDANARRRAALDSRRAAPQTASTAKTEASTKEAQAGQAEPAKPDHSGDCSILASGTANCLNGTWKLLQSGFGIASDEKPLQPGIEPPRKLLTEPPAGYRAATVTPQTTGDKSQAQADTPAPAPNGFLKALGFGKSADD